MKRLLPAAPKQREAVGRASLRRRRRPRPNSGSGRAVAPSRPPTSCAFGAVLRREGLYSSLLTDWRRQRDAGAYEALKAVRRGPKPAVLPPLAAEHARLQRDYKNVTLRLQRAEAVIAFPRHGKKKFLLQMTPLKRA